MSLGPAFRSIAASAVALAVSAGGLMLSSTADAQTASVARGQKIAELRCAKCHAIGRADVSPNPKAIPFRDVGKLYPLDHLSEALAEGIVTGDNEMPEFKFGPKDVDAIIDYLAELSANK